MLEHDQPTLIPGPGEILAEVAQGLRNTVLRGDLNCFEAQNIFSRAQRELNILYLSYPNLPFETGSTQLTALMQESQRLKTIAS